MEGFLLVLITVLLLSLLLLYIILLLLIFFWLYYYIIIFCWLSFSLWLYQCHVASNTQHLQPVVVSAWRMVKGKLTFWFIPIKDKPLKVTSLGRPQASFEWLMNHVLSYHDNQYNTRRINTCRGIWNQSCLKFSYVSIVACSSCHGHELIADDWINMWAMKKRLLGHCNTLGCTDYYSSLWESLFTN